MDIQTQSALISAALLIAIGISVAIQGRRVEHRWSYVGLVGAVFLYNLSFFINRAAQSPFWRRVILASALAIGVTSLRFFGAYLGRSMAPARRTLQVLAITTVIMLSTRLADTLLAAVLVAIISLGAYGFAVMQLHRGWRRVSSPTEHRRLRYLVLGGWISFGVNALDMLPAANVNFPAFGHVFTALYLYFWGQVIQRQRVLDLREQLGRGLSLALMTTATSFIFFLLVSWGDLGQVYFNTLLGGVVLFFLYEPLRNLVAQWVGRALFRDTQNLKVEMAQLRRELAKVINLGDLVDRILERFQASRRVTHASVFLLEDEGRAFFAPRSAGPLQLNRLDVVRERHFINALRNGDVLVLDDLERELADNDANESERGRLQAIVQTMEAISANLSFGLRTGDRLLGVLNVRDERVREAFSSTEIQLIATITRQAATVVENSELFERLKARDRLSIIGELATGLAHEIRNPLGSIKAAGQLLQPDTLDEEQREFVDVIIEESNRLNAVLTQFLDYARPFRGRLETIRLLPLLERVLTLVQTSEPAQQITLTRAFSAQLPSVLGDADRLQQVLLNLTINACEAMSAGGTLTVGATIEGERIRIWVRDDGEGIPLEIQANLFIPFFTTKRKGTGLGLAITERILQHHGTRVRVESTVGEGTEMSFRLPIADSETANRLSGEHRRRLAAETP